MIRIVALALCCLLPACVNAQEAAKKLTGTEWLQQLVGEWTYDNEATMEPGKPPMKLKGTATARAIGQHWVTIETKGDIFGQTMIGVMTLGYDDNKKKHIGTWIDSMQAVMMKYEGDLVGNVLTLNTTGPNPMAPDKQCKFKDVIELKDKNTHTLTSSMEMEDGKWFTFMKATYTRK
jgi:hypothetical protein